MPDWIRHEVAEYRYALTLPAGWRRHPPNLDNSPAETGRFHPEQGLARSVIVFAFPTAPDRDAAAVAQTLRTILERTGFAAARVAPITVGGRPGMRLDATRTDRGERWCLTEYGVVVPEGEGGYAASAGHDETSGPPNASGEQPTAYVLACSTVDDEPDHALYDAVAARLTTGDVRQDGGMSDLRLFHNPRCSKSRAALAAVQEDGTAVEIVEYLKDAPSREDLLDLLGKLEDPPGALVRRDPAFAEAGLTDADVRTAEQVADVLAARPALMERPVLVRGDRAIIGRPTERVAPFLRGE